jgi:putative phosphoribosyl transferase
LLLGLPRGGLPVAFEVARALRAPLDVFLVRQLGVPGHDELAMGAITGGGTRLVHAEVVERLSVSQPALEAVLQNEERELERRERLYRGA